MPTVAVYLRNQVITVLIFGAHFYILVAEKLSPKKDLSIICKKSNFPFLMQQSAPTLLAVENLPFSFFSFYQTRSPVFTLYIGVFKTTNLEVQKHNTDTFDETNYNKGTNSFD